MKYFFFWMILFIICSVYASAQSTASNLGITALGSAKFDTADFPLWARNLRRAEIVAFGSFPFTLFFSTLAIESYRFISHDWNTLYVPQLFRPAGGGIELTEKEQMMILTVAAVGSIVISLADFIIVQYKRHKQRQYLNSLPKGTPIIIRKPWPEEQTADTSMAEENPRLIR